MKHILISFIKIYQMLISPIMTQVFGARCRYPLSCSEYAKKEISKNGALLGSIKAFERITSCQPFGKIKHEYS